MFTEKKMTNRERFINTMDYKPVDKVPNYESGVWPQTRKRWIDEGLNEFDYHWDMFTGEDVLGLDAREFIDVNFGMLPPFEYKILEETDRYEIFIDKKGMTRKALKEGAVDKFRLCMDEFIDFPVKNRDDFREIKKRYKANLQARYPLHWKEIMLNGWKNRDHVLVLGRNCSTLGFYWRAREWMGTENLCYAWYDEPALMHEMMEFIADFTIEVSKPILHKTDVDYVFINEDMAMTNGPLLSPDLYKEFIYPHMKRLVDFYKSNGVRYVIVDSDGNTEPLLPHLLDCGVDGLWPLERAAQDTDPNFLRKKYGKSLRLWGAVDKMELSKDKEAIDAHLSEFVPLIEEGGFIPTIDHTFSPEISYENFKYYMKRKKDLLSGKF
jgi:hypothetical protein